MNQSDTRIAFDHFIQVPGVDVEQAADLIVVKVPVHLLPQELWGSVILSGGRALLPDGVLVHPADDSLQEEKLDHLLHGGQADAESSALNGQAHVVGDGGTVPEVGDELVQFLEGHRVARIRRGDLDQSPPKDGILAQVGDLLRWGVAVAKLANGQDGDEFEADEISDARPCQLNVDARQHGDLLDVKAAVDVGSKLKKKQRKF